MTPSLPFSFKDVYSDAGIEATKQECIGQVLKRVGTALRKLCTYQCQARGGGGGSGNPREFDCGVYPQGGDFDRTSCI